MRWVLLGVVAACNGEKGAPGTTDPTNLNPLDHDGDGFATPGDCDDNDAAIHPGAADAPYDGVDSDCAGDSDYDADDDGHDALGYGTGDDCDDADPNAHPGLDEVCNGIDDDCDGAVDGEGAQGAEAYYVDVDGDGFGGGDPVYLCASTTALTTVGGDCDDGDPDTWPSAPDVACDGKDNDCIDNTFELGVVDLDGVVVADLPTAIAQSHPGSVITLCEGRYLTGDLVVDHALTITGANAPITRIDGAQNRPLFVVTATDPVLLQGLSLTQGLGDVYGGVRRGGGLYVGPGGQVTATEVHVDLSIAGEGGGVFVDDGASLTLIDSSVDDNVADGYATLSGVSSGGGIRTGADVVLTLTNTTVDRNYADTCGGIDLGANGQLDGSGSSEVDDNTEGGLGGAGMCVPQGGLVTDLEIARNVAGNTGGGLVGNDVILYAVDVRDNVSGLSGGGLTLGGNSRLTSCTVESNLAGIDGGGLSMALGDLVVEYSAVTSNEATYPWFGGGFVLFEGSLTSIETDWGAGATDNVTDDASLVAKDLGYSWAGVASFVCTDPDDTCL